MEKKTRNDSNKSPLENLFELAHQEAYGLNYLIALLRPKGVANVSDPLWAAYQESKNKKAISVSEELVVESLELIYNLLELTANKDYNPFPFCVESKDTGTLRKLSLLQVSDFVSASAESYGEFLLASLVKNTFSKEALEAVIKKSEFDLSKIQKFLGKLCHLYFEARLKFKHEPLRKLPNFEVLEILSDEEHGLYGINIYFSNGTHANYERKKDQRTGLNVLTNYPIQFMVGDLSKLKPEWVVGEKRLFEIGLEGRYNKWGGVRPLFYPRGSEILLKEAQNIAKGDNTIAGILFYVMCTGHRIIEFVAKTPIEMPSNSFSLGGRMHLYKCEQSEESSHSAKDFIIYDGHYELTDLDPLSIRSAIASITVGLNRMAFSYDSSIEWCLKYGIEKEASTPKPTPTKEDLKVLNSMLVDFPSTDDAIVLDICLDWYHRGELSKKKNEFVAFLCYYIALESVAVAIAEGEADLGLNYQKDSSSERKAKKIEGIKKIHDELYGSDPEGFIRRAYFDHVIGLKQKVRKVAELVFGADHLYIKSLFEKWDGNDSLSDLRSKLAHGSITLLDPDHKKLIKKRLYELSDIVKDFVKKIIIKPDQEFPEWSGKHSFSIFPSDPRDTMVASDEKMFGTKDWRIKPEWFD